MKINTLKLKNFRNHNSLEINFKGKSALIKGFNGAGKTNILEAIHLLSTTKSLRTKYDRELINHDADFAHVVANAALNGTEATIEMTIVKNPKYINSSKKVVKIDKVSKTLANFTGTLNSVLFTPTDIEVITGSPSIRRDYIDSIFFQINREYKKASLEYAKAIRQRNKVLELIATEHRGYNQLPYWNEKILDRGEFIQNQRHKLIDFFAERMPHYANLLGNSEDLLEIKYLKNEISEKRLNDYKEKEIITKRTLVGPHRDDFEIFFNGFNIANFGSRGQQRTTILTLKLCEIDFLSEHTKKRPILLLDDIFSELDPLHREAVESIMELQQTIVTTAFNAGQNLEFTLAGNMRELY